MDEIISILQNSHKMEQLILKLKTIGENSPQFQTFKTSIQSFHLNKPPRGLHQKNILQHAFKYSDSRECFDSFRLVCKSWQNSIETIRLDIAPPITIFPELCHHERHGHFPRFYIKYLKIFKNLDVRLRHNFDLTKWSSIANLLLQNMNHLGKIRIDTEAVPFKFKIFLFYLFENSKFTLNNLSINCWDTLPVIALPNLTCFSICIYNNYNNDSGTFDYLMKTVVDVMYKDLKLFEICHIEKSPNILKHMIENYQNHFVCAPEISILEHIPLKLSHLKLSKLATYRYASSIEYLILHVKDLQVPYEDGWDYHREILSFFPNLKGVLFLYNRLYKPRV